MTKITIDISPMTNELLINNQVATPEIAIALMVQMGAVVNKNTDSDSVSYYVMGVGELKFIPEKHLTQERINVLREGDSVTYLTKKEEK